MNLKVLVFIVAVFQFGNTFCQTNFESVRSKELQLVNLIQAENSDSLRASRITNKLNPDKSKIEEALKNVLSDSTGYEYGLDELVKRRSVYFQTLSNFNFRFVGMDRFFLNYGDYDFNSVIFIQWKDKSQKSHLMNFYDMKELFEEGGFYDNLLISIDNVVPLSKGDSSKILVEASQRFYDAKEKKSWEKIIFFTIALNGEKLFLDKGGFNNKSFLSIIVDENNTVNSDLDEDSIPTILLEYPVNRYLLLNGFPKDFDNPTMVSTVLKYTGKQFVQQVSRKYLKFPDGTEEYYSFSYDSLKNDLSQKLSTVSSYNFDSDTIEDFDIENYSMETALELSLLLTHNEFVTDSSDFIQKLYVSASSNHPLNLHIYSFSFATGGTRGDVSYDVLQWTSSNGKLYSRVLPSGKGFGSIDKLNSVDSTQIYLLAGMEKVGGASLANSFYVLQFIGDSVNFEYPAFVDRPTLEIYNTDADFDSTTQTLSFTTKEYEYYFDYDYYSDNKEAIKRIKEKIECDGCEKIYLKFDGKKFIK